MYNNICHEENFKMTLMIMEMIMMIFFKLVKDLHCINMTKTNMKLFSKTAVKLCIKICHKTWKYKETLKNYLIYLVIRQEFIQYSI